MIENQTDGPKIKFGHGGPRPGAGRPKGSLGKTRTATREVADALLHLLHRAHNRQIDTEQLIDGAGILARQLAAMTKVKGPSARTASNAHSSASSASPLNCGKARAATGNHQVIRSNVG